MFPIFGKEMIIHFFVLSVLVLILYANILIHVGNKITDVKNVLWNTFLYGNKHYTNIFKLM